MSDLLHPPVPSEIRPDAKFAVVGEAPGPEEEQRGMPFIGRSGDVLRDGAAISSVSREKMSILNVSETLIGEEAADIHIGRMAKDIPRLQEELLSLRGAQHVLLIGADAVEAVLGLCGPHRDPANPKRKLTPSIMDYHGSTFTRGEAMALQVWAAENGIPTVAGLPQSVHSVSVTLHPAFALRGKPRFKLAVLMAIGRAARLSQALEGPFRPPESFFNLAPSALEVEEFLRLRDPAPITCDVETPRDRVAVDLCGVGTAGQILVFPWVAGYPDVIQAWFERPGFIVGHNFLFDLLRFASYSIRPTQKKILDTMAACGRLHPVDDEVREFPWLSLAQCVARHDPGFWFWKESERTCQRALFMAAFPWCDPSMIPRLYNGVDVWRNARLWNVVQPELMRAGMF